MSPLPLAKLAGLFIKTLSKPFAKRIKSQMVKHESTRNSLIWIGQSTHTISTKMSIWSSGFKVRSINQLEESEALAQGAEILSESIIFFVSGSILVFEYHRSSEKDRKKEELRLQLIRDDASKLQAKLSSLETRLGALEEYAKANRNSLLGLKIGTQYVKPQSFHSDDYRDESQPGEDNGYPSKTELSSSDNLVTPNNSPRSWRWLWPFR